MAMFFSCSSGWSDIETRCRRRRESQFEAARCVLETETTFASEWLWFQFWDRKLKSRIDSLGVETKGKVGVLIYLVSSVLFLDIKFDSLGDRCRIWLIIFFVSD